MDRRGALNEELLERILLRAPGLTVGVLGDLFLDRYLDLDASLTERSLETGLDAYQVVGVRAVPGAAGTIVNNLVALGVGRVVPIAVLGDDGEGYELRQALQVMPAVSAQALITAPQRRTPTYTKPLLHEMGRPPRELNRLDIKNHRPLGAELEGQVIGLLEQCLGKVHAVLVLDQVSEPNCGVVTQRVRERLAELGAAHREVFFLADSREQIGLFRNLAVKPNRRECVRAVFGPGADLGRWQQAADVLAAQAGRPVFCTAGEEGILVADGGGQVCVPAYPVGGPIDPVGAGDSTSAAIALAVACGADLAAAAAFGNLVASVTIAQIGTTGTASPQQVRQRWAEVCAGAQAAEQA
jgi:bifunctional ADP-heptose synthase (sugar kinase/adenylyltransferase)